MSQTNKLPNPSKSPLTLGAIMPKMPTGQALELISQYAPQVFNQALQEDKEIVKLDLLAQSLHLNTPELYNFNAAIENAGGDRNEVANLYETVQKLNNNDPKNKKKIETIIKYTGIPKPITEKGFVIPDFLKQLSDSERLPRLTQTEKTELYDILGVHFNSGLANLLNQGQGKLGDSAHFFEPVAPTKAQIEKAHETISIFSKGKDLFRNQVHMAEENDDFSLFKVPAEKAENALIKHATSINEGEKVIGQNPIAKFLDALDDPKARQKIGAFLNKTLATMAAGSGPLPPLPISPFPIMPLYSKKEVSPPLPLQNFAKEIDHARKNVLTERSYQADYFHTLNQKEKQGLGNRPLSLSFGNINVTTQEDDNPFAFAEAVKEVVADELLKVIASTSPFR